MTRMPEPAREAARIDQAAVRRFGVLRSLACYFDTDGLFTQWYWPADQQIRGKMFNVTHGKGWRIE